MYNPKPVPPVSDFVANFENIFGKIFGSMPIPVSLILMRTSLFLLSNLTTMVNLIALDRRLDR
jgi:hypothetical protein